MKLTTILLLILVSFVMSSSIENMRKRDGNKKQEETLNKIIEIVDEYKNESETDKPSEKKLDPSTTDTLKTPEEKSKDKLSKLLGTGAEEAINKSFEDLKKNNDKKNSTHEELKTILQDKPYTLKELLDKQLELHNNKKNNSKNVKNQVSEEQNKQLETLQKPVISTTNSSNNLKAPEVVGKGNTTTNLLKN